MVERNLILLLISIILYSCTPPAIYNKKELFSKNGIGGLEDINTEGYYYRIKEENIFYKYDLQKDGTYNKEKSFYYASKFLDILYLTNDGFIIHDGFGTSYPHNIDSVNYYNDNLIELFEKRISKSSIIEGKVRKQDTWFFTKSSQVWDQGIYKLKKDSIYTQMYKNVMGNYYLVSYKGIINKDSLVLISAYAYRENKNYKDRIIYKFKPYKIGEVKSFIKDNPNKFWNK